LLKETARVLADPEDDPVVYTAAIGRAEVLCAMDRHLYGPAVVDFCRERGIEMIEIMNDVELMQRLRTPR